MGLHAILTHLYYVSLPFNINRWVPTPLQRASLARSNSRICRLISHLLAILLVGIYLKGIHSAAQAIREGFFIYDINTSLDFTVNFIYHSLYSSIFAASVRRVLLIFNLDYQKKQILAVSGVVLAVIWGLGLMEFLCTNLGLGSRDSLLASYKFESAQRMPYKVECGQRFWDSYKERIQRIGELANEVYFT